MKLSLSSALSSVLPLVLAAVLAGAPVLLLADQALTAPYSPSREELPRGPGPIQGRGVVLQVEPKKARIKIDHEPIPALNWPRMTMPFRLKDPVSASTLKKGDVVEFALEKAGSSYVIAEIKKQGSAGGRQ